MTKKQMDKMIIGLLAGVWDDAGLIRSDEFPSKGNNSAGTDLADYNLWVLIKLGSPTFGHDG